MLSTHTLHESWHPQTRQEKAVVLRELETILASPHFCNSRRYPALLKYLVENALAGRVDLLKERTLGIEVFDRPADYDTNSDTVVRYTAGEVRKRLMLYYSELEAPPSIRISLPAGSYLPEFYRAHPDSPEEESTVSADSTVQPHSNLVMHGVHDVETAESHSPQRTAHASGKSKRLLWAALIALIFVVAISLFWWRSRALVPKTDTEVANFWGPVLRDQQTVVVCTGSVVFTNQRNYSGVITASRDIDYPFVSWQGALAIAKVSGVLSHFNTGMQLASAPSTPLTNLREHTVVLLGAYNNQWTMHLQQPLRFFFLPGDDEVIQDRLHPEVQWKRDQSQPYSSADDYAVLARFRDPTIDGWVIMLAGVGRNGTEAAVQFVTSARYMQLLRDRVGSDFSNRNIEAVLKVSVIDGKTGAPAILAVHTW